MLELCSLSCKTMQNGAHLNKSSLMMFIKDNKLHEKHKQEYNIGR